MNQLVGFIILVCGIFCVGANPEWTNYEQRMWSSQVCLVGLLIGIGSWLEDIYENIKNKDKK